MVLSDHRPVVNRSPAHGVCTNANVCIANIVEAKHLIQLRYVIELEIEMVRGWGLALHAGHATKNQLIGPVGNPTSGIRISRSTVRRVVFDTAILWWDVARGNDNSISHRKKSAVP